MEIKNNTYLNNIVLLVTIATPLSLVMSFFHDAVFFNNLGISLKVLPYTLSDFLRSVLTWFPAMIFLIGMFYGFAGTFLEDSEGEAKKQEKETLLERLAFHSMTVFVLLAPCYVLWKNSNDNTNFLILFIVYFSARYLFRALKIGLINDWQFRISIYLTALFLLLLLYGVFESNEIINSPKTTHILKELNSGAEQNIVIVKIFSKGIFYKDKEDNFKFANWDNVESYTILEN